MAFDCALDCAAASGFDVDGPNDACDRPYVDSTLFYAPVDDDAPPIFLPKSLASAPVDDDAPPMFLPTSLASVPSFASGGLDQHAFALFKDLSWEMRNLHTRVAVIEGHDCLGHRAHLESRLELLASVSETHHHKLSKHVDNLHAEIVDCESILVSLGGPCRLGPRPPRRGSADSALAASMSDEVEKLSSKVASAELEQSRVRERLQKVEDGMTDHAHLFFSKLGAYPLRDEMDSLALRTVSDCRNCMIQACQTMDGKFATLRKDLEAVFADIHHNTIAHTERLEKMEDSVSQLRTGLRLCEAAVGVASRQHALSLQARGSGSALEKLSAEVAVVRKDLSRTPELLATHLQKSILTVTGDLSSSFLTLIQQIESDLGGRLAALEALAKAPSIAGPASSENWADGQGSSGDDEIDWV